MPLGDDMLSFAHDWRAEVLARPPLIAPARQFTYPQQIAGEEDALAQLLERLFERRARLPELIDACRTARVNPFPMWE